MQMILSLAMPLAATVLLEMGVLAMMRQRSARIMAASAAVNLLTNVPLNYFFQGSTFQAILWAEAAIVAIEALWYYIFVREAKTAIVYSALCNAVSFFSGLLFFLLISLFK